MSIPGGVDTVIPMLTLCELEEPPSFKGVVKVYNNPRALETISELECGHFVSIKAKQVDLPFLGKQPNIIVTYGTLEQKEEKEGKEEERKEYREGKKTEEPNPKS